MIFKRMALPEAAGALLAHSARLPGRMLPKGAVLDEAALAALKSQGISSVLAARLEPGDVGEDDAAARLARALCGDGLRPTPAQAGRVNLAACRDGLVRVGAARVENVNLLDERITVATLRDATRVAAGDLVATIKIIPFAVADELLTAAEMRAGPEPALHVCAFQPLKAGLVVTELPGLKPSVIQGTLDVTSARLRALGGTLLPPLRLPHDQEAVARGLSELRAQGAELLLVAGATATVDRDDVAPAAVVQAGGVITHFGMPVDPGNLLCLGRVGAVPVVILPGCARSAKLNGIDFVLSRIFAGEEITPDVLRGMGVGGLLKDAAARPMPRNAGGPGPAAPSGVAAIVLAAGLSSRMAPANKLLMAGEDGRAMVARVVDQALASAARQVSVVTGYERNEVAAALDARDIRLVHAVDFERGLSASLRAGIAALPSTMAAVLVCLGDMPLVTAAIMDRLIAAHDPEMGRLIVVPIFRGKRGNPVLWDRRFFPEMATLEGDAGARALLVRHAEHVIEVDVGDDAVLRDFDTPESFAARPGAAPLHAAGTGALEDR